MLHHAAAAARAALSSAISTSRAAGGAAAQPQMLPVGREAMGPSVAKRQPPLAGPGSSPQQDRVPATVRPKEEPLTENPSGGGFAEVSACSLQLSFATKSEGELPAFSSKLSSGILSAASSWFSSCIAPIAECILNLPPLLLCTCCQLPQLEAISSKIRPPLVK